MGRTCRNGRWGGRHLPRSEPLVDLSPVPLNGVSGPPYVNFVNFSKNEQGEVREATVRSGKERGDNAA